MTTIFGKEIEATWVDTSDADWRNKGAQEHIDVIGSGATTDIALQKQGGGWALRQKAGSNNVTGIAMLSADSGWAVGEGGKIFRTNDGGATWESVASPTDANLWAVAFANPSFGFAVGDNGIILKWNGSSWKAVESTTSLSLLGVALSGSQKGIAVGEGGTILEWDGSAWTQVDPSPTDTLLFGITIANNRAFAVGEGGTIVTWDGASWSGMQQSLTAKNLLAVRLFSQSFGIAVGEGGTILHWNGSSWSKKKGSGPDMNSIAIASGSNAVAGGSDGTIVRWDGSGWATESIATSESILGIAAPTTTTNVAIGSTGFTATYEGVTYAGEGTYTSGTKDAGKEVSWDFLQWSTKGATVKFQLAANNDNLTWRYTGPDGTEGNYYTQANGQTIDPSLGKKRYIRYRAFFTTNDTNTTPLLHSVTLHSKEEIADEPAPKKDEPKPIVEEKKVTPETPPPPLPEETKKTPLQPVQEKSSAPETTTPAPSPSSSATATGGGGFTQRVIAPEPLLPAANALLQNDTLTLQWEGTEATPSYTLQIDRTPSFVALVVQTTVSATTYTHPMLLPPGSYFWRVRPEIPETSDRRGDWSAAATFTLTDKPPLPKVASATLSKPIEIDSGTVTLEGIAFPRATVRVIITSNIVEKTVVADENGAWQIEIPRSLFASGQHLAQAQIFTAEGQVTPAITIGEFFIPFPPPPTKNVAVATARAIGAAATQAADATKKVARKTVEETAVVAAQTEKVIQENKTETQVALTATVPIVTVANPTVLPMLSNLHLLFYHFISGVLSLFGIKRKRRAWGVVYDAITKEPIGLAIVRLFDAQTPITKQGVVTGQRKLIETQVTDDAGRFGFLVQPSSYMLEVVKQDFIYPSKLVTGKTDGDFEDCYHGETLTTKEGAINVSVPLDPLNRKEARKKQPLLLTAKSVMHTLALPLLLIGWTSSWLVTLFAYSVTNLGMTFIYLFFAIIHVALLPKKFRPWGTVFSAGTLEAVPLAVISIIDTKFNRVLKTRLTDYSGRFNFLPPAGEYKLSVKKEGFDFPSKTKPETRKFRNLYFGQNIIVKKERAIVSTDVPVEKK
ncbi:hypothetical protein HY625_02405 [Candidatus Uhrbacteria bacterium]|nr:hypothetical protein [Candidatus Uhrbacteria bacterium]